MSYINLPIISGFPLAFPAGSASGRLTVDFSGFTQLYTATITGATAFSGIGYRPGGSIAMRVNVSGTVGQALSFPAGWNWLTSVPTGLATGRFAALSLNSFATAESGVLAAWAVAP